MAGMLGIWVKLSAAQPQLWINEDCDRCTLLVAMYKELHKHALSIVGSEKDQAWDAPRCTMLMACAPYCSTAMLNPGGSGVLEPELRQNVVPALRHARAAHSSACGQHSQSRLIDQFGP